MYTHARSLLKCGPCNKSLLRANQDAHHVCLINTNTPGEKQTLELCTFKEEGSDDMLIQTNQPPEATCDTTLSAPSDP